MIGNKRACSFGDISTPFSPPAFGLLAIAVSTDNDSRCAGRFLPGTRQGMFKYDNVRIGMNSRLDTRKPPS